MIGTLINAAAILAGGIAGLTTTKDLSPGRQDLIKKLLGIFTVWVGLSMSWAGLDGSLGRALRQLIIVILALMLGKAAGQLLRLQHAFNKLGRYAKGLFEQAKPKASRQVTEGFITCTLLFCLGPLAILGSLQEGLFGNPRALIIKACMDGLAAMAFARVFGWGALISALPVLAYQGTLSLLAQFLESFLRCHSLLDSVGATTGLLIFCVALVILELKKIELADYLPSLVCAPLLSWVWR
jgi:uncharacterized membrane protein YqgA involved in biofilm formation